MCEKSMRKRQASIPEKIGQLMRLVDQLLRGAIRNKRLIEFEYQQLKRMAEPHDLGFRTEYRKYWSTKYPAAVRVDAFRIGA